MAFDPKHPSVAISSSSKPKRKRQRTPTNLTAIAAMLRIVEAKSPKQIAAEKRWQRLTGRSGSDTRAGWQLHYIQ
jgi:hypothetical protein